MLRLGSQVRIEGWRRLGAGALAEFSEGALPAEQAEQPLFLPPAVVKVLRLVEN